MTHRTWYNTRMENETIIIIVCAIVNCVLFFALGRIHGYRAECKRAGNL